MVFVSDTEHHIRCFFSVDSFTIGHILRKDSNPLPTRQEVTLMEARKPHLTVSDLVKLMKVKPETIQSLILRGKLEAYRVNPSSRRNNFRVSPDAFERFQQLNRVLPI